MKRVLFLTAIMACAMMFVSVAKAQEAATGTADVSGQPQCFVSINGIVGTVETQPATAENKDIWASATLNQCMNVGDHLRTAVESKAAVRYGDGIQLRINSSATLTIAQTEGAAQPDSAGLDLGELYTEMDKAKAGDAADFKVNTPSGVVAVRGTQFNVLVDAEGKSKVNVLEGVVSVLNDLGEVLAEAGFATELLKGAIPLTPEAFNVEEFKNQLNQWKDAISIGKVLGAVKDKINDKKEEIKDKVNIKKKLGF